MKKFQVGKEYCCFCRTDRGDELRKVFIRAKYQDNLDLKIKVVVDDKVYIVHKGLDKTEYIVIYQSPLMASDEWKAERTKNEKV